MSKFNIPASKPVRTNPIQTKTSMPDITTHQGGPGYSRDSKSELFLLAITNMVGEKTFYEAAGARDQRFAYLCREVAVADGEWFLKFVLWLRQRAQMRSASMVAACQGVDARLKAKVPVNRAIISSVLVRADEPGELIAYWRSTIKSKLPSAVRRGIADAITGRVIGGEQEGAPGLYSEFNLLKYDTPSHGFRFADAINLVKPKPIDSYQAHLFKYAIENRFGRDWAPTNARTPILPMIGANKKLRSLAITDPGALLYTPLLQEAGMTWEDTLSLAGPRLNKKAMWEALIPVMGYMALLRNLRNFDEAGVSDEVAKVVADKLTDPRQVARSRQLPLRFLSAYRNAPSLRWSYALERALQLSLESITELPGQTLILVDTSGSMHSRLSAKSDLLRWDAAVVFGLAMAARCEQATVVSFSDQHKIFMPRAGESLLSQVKRWKDEGYFFGGGTNTLGTLANYLPVRPWNRIIIATDEQTDNFTSGYSSYGYYSREHNPTTITNVVPATMPMYTWNLAGYAAGHAPSTPNWHTFGGLNDASFSMVSMLESGRDGSWPWEYRTS